MLHPPWDEHTAASYVEEDSKDDEEYGHAGHHGQHNLDGVCGRHGLPVGGLGQGRGRLRMRAETQKHTGTTTAAVWYLMANTVCTFCSYSEALLILLLRHFL